MIQELSYTIKEYSLDYFYTSGPKYDRRIAVCVGPKGMQDIPVSYGRSDRTPTVINYKDESFLSFHFKQLTHRSKLLLVGHGGPTALREKSSCEAPPTKPDFSVEMAAQLFKKEAPQLRDPEGETPSQLFRISLVSCKALQYGVELSLALAKQGISNQITARTLSVAFGLYGSKEVEYQASQFAHHLTGSKVLITTYAQCPSLSHLELINYQGNPSNQFVWVPNSIKPLQSVRLPDQSITAYTSLFRAIDMLGIKTPPISLLYDVLENIQEKETLGYLSSKYFADTESGTENLKIFLEHTFKTSLDPDCLANLLKSAQATLPGTVDSWIKFAIDHDTHPKTLLTFLQIVRSQRRKDTPIQLDTLVYAIEKNTRIDTLQNLLDSLSSSDLATLTLSGLSNSYRPDVQLLLFQKRAASFSSIDSTSMNPEPIAHELLQQIADKKLSPSFLTAIIPHLHPREIEKIIEMGIFQKTDISILELFLNTTHQIKLNAYLLLKIDSPFLEKLLLQHVLVLPHSFQNRRLILKKYPELSKLIKKPQTITMKSRPISKFQKSIDDFS